MMDWWTGASFLYCSAPASHLASRSRAEDGEMMRLAKVAVAQVGRATAATGFDLTLKPSVKPGSECPTQTVKTTQCDSVIFVLAKCLCCVERCAAWQPPCLVVEQPVDQCDR